ncbi:MAG: hypothetical protein HY800_07750 [Ignavibacteriales bacterium]|nr:hypothetical protein [Ignavibacteriales bacterium]
MTELNSEEEHDQRLHNQLKKMELAAKYGAYFNDGESDIPVNIEAQWLKNIEEFEKQFENCRRIKIREFIGNPTFKPLNEIPSEEIENELIDILDFFELHSIVVESVAGVSDQELYRFITEEFMDVETDYVRIEGMMHHFIYEEFHPNDEYDVKNDAEDFLSSLFWLEADLVSHHVAKEGVLDANGKPISNQKMKKAITDFRLSFKSFKRPMLEIISCKLAGEQAEVSIQTEWTGIMDDKSPPIHKSGIGNLKLVRSPYGGWDVYQAIVPGWNDA